MFGKWIKSNAPEPADGSVEQLETIVRRQLPSADATTVAVVAAIAGLLGAIAYADRQYRPEEESRIRSELARIAGMTGQGVDAICAAIREHLVEMATVQAPHYARTLRELADRELRREVLALMLEIGASDDELTNVETNLLRTVTGALGLTQDDYNALQEKHRAKLSVLAPS